RIPRRRRNTPVHRIKPLGLTGEVGGWRVHLSGIVERQVRGEVRAVNRVAVNGPVHLEAPAHRHAPDKLELVPVRYPWYRPQLLMQAARPVAEPEGVRIVQEIRAGGHVTVRIELPLNGPSPEEESSSRQPGRHGCLEAVVRVG